MLGIRDGQDLDSGSVKPCGLQKLSRLRWFIRENLEPTCMPWLTWESFQHGIS